MKRIFKRQAKEWMRLLIVLLTVLLPLTGFAGNLDSPGSPTAGSGMPTLTDIYNQLDSGLVPSPQSSFQEPASGPTAGTGKSLANIQSKIPVPDNANGAKTDEVLSGKTFWGLRTDGSWGPNTGSMSSGGDVSGGDGQRTFSMPDGYYSGRTATASDTNLNSDNIKGGVTIFGVSGNSAIIDTRDKTSLTNACSVDTDGDGMPDWQDVCPLNPNKTMSVGVCYIAVGDSRANACKYHESCPDGRKCLTYCNDDAINYPNPCSDTPCP